MFVRERNKDKCIYRITKVISPTGEQEGKKACLVSGGCHAATVRGV